MAFVARSVDRLRVLADHAALGLWKLRLVDQAQAANHAKSDFMTAMSHELRTPLTALAGYAELLAERDAGPLSPVQIDVVQRMQSVTDHLAGLIDELLTYSSLDASVADEEVEHVRVLLGEVVQASVAAVKPEADEKGITLDCEVLDDLALRTDPRRLQQILAHLLSNAVKFTDRGHVRFRHVVESGWVRLHIEDTGIGIAPEHRDRIFQPFTQLDSGLRRRHRGAGLGLFISRRLAAQIGGTIDYRSTVGKGSAFTVSIPA
jgi:signal transduction histidine kinase